jgi:hypothetical protein
MAEEDNNKKQLSNITQELGELSVETRKSAAVSKDILKVSQETLSSIRGLNLGLQQLKAIGGNQLSEMRIQKVSSSSFSNLGHLPEIKQTLVDQLKVMEGEALESKKKNIDEKRKGNPFKALSKSLGGLVKRLDPSNLAKAFAGAIPKPKTGGGSLLKSLGKAGLIIGGLGILAAGGAALFQAFQEFDATKVTDNVKELLSIGDKLEETDIDFLKEGGKFGLAMAGIGAGLGLFGIGSAFAGAADKWLDNDWAQDVVDNVTTLLKINKLGGEDYSFLKEGGSLGGALAGIGIGLGLFGIGSAITGAASKWIEGGWAEKVVSNVKTLLQIGDAEDEKIKAFDGLGFGAALSAIGVGLTAFAASEGIVSAISLFTGDGWAQNVVDDVKTLLQLGDGPYIQDEITLLGGAGLGIALGAIGVGLVAFAAGEGVAAAVTFFTGDGWAENVVSDVKTLLSVGSDNVFGMLSTAFDGVAFGVTLGAIGAGLIAFAGAEGIKSAIDFFSGDAWAQDVVDQVDTLLGIVSLKTGVESLGFAATMTAIGAGLVAFGAGEGVVAAVEMFSKGTWAQDVVDNVETLLSIVDLENMSVEKVSGVTATMGALGLGLAAFGFGQAAVGVAEAINKFSSDEDFADKIKRQVKTLLSIPELMGDDPENTAKQLKTTLTTIGEGIAGFGSESFTDMLKNAGEAILGFFGVKSPFSKILSIADNAADLKIGAAAIDKLVDALERLKELNFKMPKVDFSELAKQLGRAVPLLRAATSGGVIDGGWFGETLDFGPAKGPGKGGLLDPDLNIEELARVVSMFTGAMSGQGYSVGELKTPVNTFDFTGSNFPTAAEPSGNISGLVHEAEAPTEKLVVYQEEKRENEVAMQAPGAGVGAMAIDNSNNTINNATTNNYQDVNTPTQDYTDYNWAMKPTGTR